MADKDDAEKSIETVTDQERDLAQNALTEFRKKNYNGALQNLNKLENSRPTDFKVAHNKAIVEYHKNDLKKIEVFQKNLTTICDKFRIKIESLDNIDQCIIHYNQAILLYHQRQYMAAIQIMDRVYKFIEPMDDALARAVSLFNIELQLCIRQPDLALSLINYMENQLNNVGSNIRQLDKNAKDKNKKGPPQDPASLEFRRKLTQLKIRCLLMNHSLDLAGNTMKSFYKDKNNINYLFLNANLEYLKGNLQESYKILESIPKDCLVYNECGESFTVMYYNSLGILHHALGKRNLATHYFQTALKEDMAVASVTKSDLNDKQLHTLGGSKYHELMYNLGIALLYAKRPTHAFECLIIAVRRYHRNSRLWLRLAECCVMIHKESNEPDYDMSQKQKGIFTEIVGPKDKQKAILTTNLSKDKKYSTENQSYAVPVPSLEFASLCLRNAFLLLPSNPSSTSSSSSSASSTGGSTGGGGPNTAAAAATSSSGAAPVTPVVPLFLIPGVPPPVPSLSPGPSPSSPMTSDSVANLRNSILATSAYVALCLGDYIIALEHSRELLAQQRLSGVHKFLAHLYCAESLVLLDKISEALDHLNPENVKELTLELPQSEETSIQTTPPYKWFPDSLASAHATMQYNIAVAKTIRGQLDEAMTLLKQIWQMNKKCKIPGYIIMLVLYIELQQGTSETAKNLIKQKLVQNRVMYY